MLKFHALEINYTTGTVTLDGLPITVLGDIRPRLAADERLLTVTMTLPLSSITVKTPGGSAHVEAGE